MDLGFIVHCLDEKRKLLQQKLMDNSFVGYNQKEGIEMPVAKIDDDEILIQDQKESDDEDKDSQDEN